MEAFMKVILFGASGMVGQGVLRECLLDPGVDEVLTIGRSPLRPAERWLGLDAGARAKLREIVHKDLTDFSAIEPQLAGYEACFFCLGVSSAGMTEEAYRRVTYDITLAAGQTLVRLNPGMTFIYVSGHGTDSTGKGRVMWARVKGQTENALLSLPFKGAYMFRPGPIVALHGIVSRTRVYRWGYVLAAPIIPLLLRMFPKQVTTTEQLGRAMLAVTRKGYPKPVLEPSDITTF
jgi:uncharacterized protein YbjT (DUF2867 family)